MSKVKRYFVVIGYNPEPYTEMVSDIDGDYVRYEDYAALRAELVEKEAELAKLKRQREQTEFEFRNLDKMHSVIIERYNGLLKENAELRGRLKPVEEVWSKLEGMTGERELLYNPRVLCRDLWQAIEAACEKGE